MIDPATSAPPSETRHVAVLDGIRGLAILLVMPSHFWGLAFGIAGRAPGNALDRWLDRLFGSGWIGVDLFFVLSGFLITGILLDAREGPGFFRSFYARRFLRIFPLYYGFLVVMLLVVPHISVLARVADIDNLRANQWWYWTYSMNVGNAFTDLNFSGTLVHSQFWSLAVEEQFYLVWPAAVLLLRPPRLAAFCVVLLVACPALRIVLASDAASGWAAPNAAHVLSPARMDTFALGALLAIAARPGDALRDIARYAPLIAVGALAVVAGLFVRGEGLRIIQFDGTGFVASAGVQTFGFSALGLLFAALLAMTVTARAGSLLHKIFSAAPLTWMGRYAYGLYVVHVLVAFFLAERIINVRWMRDIYLREFAGLEAPANLATTVTGIAISCAIAWASWHLYENQFLKLKRYVPYGRPAAARRPAEPPASATEQPTMSLP
jgi:peptidoglycan/LPS O-acetylase OafA/YrhL